MRAHNHSPLEAALAYAQMGYAVLPLQPGGKRPHLKLVPHGLKEASREAGTLEAWWGRDPEAGVGLLPGPEVLVLDADGPEVVEALLAHWPELEAAPRVRTPRGGGHFYLRVPLPLAKGLHTGRAKGLEEFGPADLKGLERGYLVAPPTTLPTGSYAWEVALVRPGELPQAPDSLLVRLLPPPLPPREVRVGGSSPRRLQALLEAYAKKVAATPPGQRHNTLIAYARAAGGLVPHGLDPKEAEEALAGAAMRGGLPEREARAAVRWGLEVGRAQPLPLEPSEPPQGPTFQDLLKRVEEAKAENLPAILPELFRGLYEGGLMDTEVEALFQALRKKTGVSLKALRKDWARYRATREEEARQEEAPVLSPEALEAARELSQDPALLHRAIQTIGALGVVGEEENRGLLYLALLSAKTEAPISILVKGRSSSGKSFLVSSMLKLIPPRGYYELSSMSTKALVYADIDFSHRHLVLYEEDGMVSEELLYLVRTLLSEGQIRYLTVEKTPQGRMAAREIFRPGPTGLITTMTKGLTKEDNESRTFSLYMNDSKPHTLRVVQALAEREARGVRLEVDAAPWHALYEALPQVGVVVPYAPVIARLLEAQDLPEDLTRLRRDFGRFLTLVKVVTLLHHARREEHEGHLVATLEDYALAYHLAARTVARSVHTVSPQALVLAQAVGEVYTVKREAARDKDDVAVFVKDLAKHLRWSKRTVQKWVDQAETAGLIDVQKDGNRLAMKPVEGAPLEEAAFRLLPEPERLARELSLGGSYVHPVTGERCALYLPQSACAFSPKTEEIALQDEENHRARIAHERARTPQEPRPGAKKPRAHSEAAPPSQNPEERARFLLRGTSLTAPDLPEDDGVEIEVEVEL